MQDRDVGPIHVDRHVPIGQHAFETLEIRKGPFILQRPNWVLPQEGCLEWRYCPRRRPRLPIRRLIIREQWHLGLVLEQTLRVPRDVVVLTDIALSTESWTWRQDTSAPRPCTAGARIPDETSHPIRISAETGELDLLSVHLYHIGSPQPSTSR